LKKFNNQIKNYTNNLVNSYNMFCVPTEHGYGMFCEDTEHGSSLVCVLTDQF